MKILAKILAFRDDEGGATAIEYGMIAAAMALMLIPAISGVLDNTNGMYQAILGIFDHPIFDEGYFS